jgi:formate hydrogenlyase subunit 3/multisubunit Na+/H+ antiporter MnhD subunit
MEKECLEKLVRKKCFTRSSEYCIVSSTTSLSTFMTIVRLNVKKIKYIPGDSGPTYNSDRIGGLTSLTLPIGVIGFLVSFFEDCRIWPSKNVFSTSFLLLLLSIYCIMYCKCKVVSGGQSYSNFVTP